MKKTLKGYRRWRRFRKGRISYAIGRVKERSLLEAEFEHARWRGVQDRIRRGWIRTYQPVLDDAPYRIFATLKEYVRWCEKNLPPWLGYEKVA